MQDQLILFMALAEGRSSMLCGELTLHTRTAMSIAEQLLPGVKFAVSALSGADAADAKAQEKCLYMVQCTGAGAVGGGA